MNGRTLIAIRGATTVEADDPQLIRVGTREMLIVLLERNGLEPVHLISALFTMTTDLTSDFPARAARELGWTALPMLCAVEVPVPDSLARCIRVLVLAWGASPDARHVYLGGARALRPELGNGG